MQGTLVVVAAAVLVERPPHLLIVAVGLATGAALCLECVGILQPIL
jgi:hypothetical protein